MAEEEGAVAVVTNAESLSTALKLVVVGVEAILAMAVGSKSSFFPLAQ